jgi:hypothetical protein
MARTAEARKFFLKMSLSASTARDKHKIIQNNLEINNNNDIDDDDEDPKVQAAREEKKRKMLQEQVHSINQMSGEFLNSQSTTIASSIGVGLNSTDQPRSSGVAQVTPATQSEFALQDSDEDDFGDWEDAEGKTIQDDEKKNVDDGTINMLVQICFVL